jgi:MFS family permease
VSLWRHREFQKWWWGQSVSLIGTQFTQLALPLTAILNLHASAAQMGILVAMQAAPGLVFSLVAGIWLDRVQRKPILVGSQLVAMTALASVPSAALLGVLSMPQLYVVALLIGTAATFTYVAQSSLLPALVGRPNLIEANAKYQTSWTVSQIVGPGLAGFAVQVLTAPIAIAIDALSFLVGAASTAWAKVAEPAPGPAAPGRSLGQELMEGFRFVATQPQMRSIVLTLVLANWGGALTNAVFLLLFVSSIGLTPAQIGLGFAAAALFSLVGAQLAGRVVSRVGVGPAMGGACLLFALARLIQVPAAYAAAGPAFAILLASSVAFGGLMIYNINQQAIRGAVTPDRLLGRANAAVHGIVIGGSVLFALLGGALGQAIGLRPTYVIGSLLVASCTIPALMPSLRRLKAVPQPASG